MSNMMELTGFDLDEPERPALSPELALLEKRYNLAAARWFPKGTNVKVTLHEENGEVLMDIKGVPVDQVHVLVDVLTRPLPGTPDALGPQLPLPIRPS
ncbi:hypothetical protein [Hyalangium versicolor]|uniref:hypothetical protein n=1 Tax=Hyalangium versicolor TaxID=2861190 RepID=UPI001CCC88A7|nr:hypothetical protein [Hyalangium versicolor]